ncbi:MAG TPA: DUF1592 domain-containing protein [Marinagarivorans sp.]
MRNPLALFFLTLPLLACTGAQVPGSSSESSAHESSADTVSSSSSSSAIATGDPDNGATLFASNALSCNFCHTDNGDGTFGGNRSFNVNQFTYPNSDTYAGLGYSSATEQDLALFLSAEMPASGGCDAQCGADIAAYLWSLRGLAQNIDPVGCTSEDPVLYGKRALKLLTSFEYDNSLRSLFTAPLPDDFSSSFRANIDKNIANMPNHISEPVGETRLNTYARNAEELAEWALITEGQNPLPFSCADEQAVECANAFIEKFAYPAYRRPLNADEQMLYTKMITESPIGLQVAVQSVLMSPQFLYRSELGTKVSEARDDPMFRYGNDSAQQDSLAQADPSAYVLDPYEYASVLSYMYTASSPDAQLLAAAGNGDLANPAMVEMHIDRMLDSDLGRAQVGRFAGMWFRTDKVVDADRSGNPGFTQTVKDSMAREIRELYKHVFYDENLPFEAIYTGDFTLVNSVLSDFYGLPGGTHPDVFTPVSTVGTPRGGVIASGAFMASNSARERTSPIKRAVHFRQDVLCQIIDLPPAFGEDPEQDKIRDAAAAEVVEAQSSGTLTTTDAFHMQTGKPGTICAGCHRSVINPLFAIDDFDNVGLARKRNAAGEVVQKGLGPNGQEDVPIDMINNSGYLFAAHLTGVVDSGLADAENAAGQGLAFKGAKGLGQAIVDAELPGVEACLIEKSFRFAAGYPLSSAQALQLEGEQITEREKAHFACVSDNLKSALNQHNNSPRAMMKAMGTSDVIRFRR